MKQKQIQVEYKILILNAANLISISIPNELLYNSFLPFS